MFSKYSVILKNVLKCTKKFSYEFSVKLFVELFYSHCTTYSEYRYENAYKFLL